MTLDPVRVATRWSQQLPREFARDLANALREGRPALLSLRGRVALASSTVAVKDAIKLHGQGDGPFAAGILIGQLEAQQSSPTVVPVWTGPESTSGQGRLTLAVVADLIAEAQRELLLVSYATYPGPNVLLSLRDAVARGVAVTLLLERSTDNPNFHGHDDPFPGLTARRLAWPLAARAGDASMHAKLLVVDRCTALVGSANLTGHALERNLECGVLIRGGRVPSQLVDHVLTAHDLQEV
jgi:phosphatidylserine/phosphatidylglycerophosphate/cardiolipin synthase-like enzyme